MMIRSGRVFAFFYDFRGTRVNKIRLRCREFNPKEIQVTIATSQMVRLWKEIMSDPRQWVPVNGPKMIHSRDKVQLR